MKRIGDFLAGITPIYRHKCSSCGEPMIAAGECSVCADRKQLAAMWEGCPERYRQARFGSQELQERVRDRGALLRAPTALQTKKVVVLAGPAGVGKTTLAAAICDAWVRQHRRYAYYVSSLTLATCRADSALGAEPLAMRMAKRAPLLLLDDLGIEPMTTTSAVTEVLFARHEANLSLVVTCAIDIAELGHRYGTGGSRRVVEESDIYQMSVTT
jgi:DNA replication protein DnaC